MATKRTEIDSTQLIHHPYVAPKDFDSPQLPVYKASTVIFPNVREMKRRRWQDKSAYTYGLHGTPSTFVLEERLATLEGGLFCTLTPSGLSAIAHVHMALLQTGDHVLVPDNVYGPSISMLEHLLSQFGVTSSRYDPMSLEDFKRELRPQTRLVWLEAAGSVTMEFPNLLGLVQAVKEHNAQYAQPTHRSPKEEEERVHREALCALDNTWGAGLAFNAFDAGVDLTVHALTKYPSGGADVLMGSVVSRSKDIAHALSNAHMYMGTGVGAHDVDAILKGLHSLVLRYDAQDQAARTVAKYLLQEPAIEEVMHPFLPSSEGHEHWRALCVSQERPEGRAAGIFSVRFNAKYSPQEVEGFCDRLKLFKLGYSWGGPVSLVVPYDIPSMRVKSAKRLGSGGVVRFCIGLENPNDLIEDLRQSLKAL